MDGVRVRVLETNVVVPSEPTPRRRLWVSSLDVNTVARGYVPVMYLYCCKPEVSSVDVVERLKAALADVLVPFYPVAGRLAIDSSERPEIDCNAEGALFTVARSDILTADYVREFAALEELRKLFVPIVESGCAMFAAQLTFLKCGAVVMGTVLHHVLGDAASASNFIRTWCKIACGSKLDDDDLPCHDRTLLCARSPPSLDMKLHAVLSQKICLSAAAVRPVTFKVFHLTAEDVADLKSLCHRRTSTFRVVTAHVWRCVCAARGLAPRSRARISFLASVRRHVRPHLPAGYFGNTTIMLNATADTRDIVTGTLASVADTIGASVERLDNDLANAAIDYLELASRDKPQPTKEGSLPDTDLKVVSWLGMPTEDADFGLGKPEFTRPPDGSTPGVVLLGTANAGGVLVSAYLEPATINLFGKLLSTTRPAY